MEADRRNKTQICLLNVFVENKKNTMTQRKEQTAFLVQWCLITAARPVWTDPVDGVNWNSSKVIYSIKQQISTQVQNRYKYKHHVGK